MDKMDNRIDNVFISDKLMGEMVDYLFSHNNKVENIILPIKKELVNEFMFEWNNVINTIGTFDLPYINFTSSNAINGLKIYIREHDSDYNVRMYGIELKTNVYTNFEGKYKFD